MTHALLTALNRKGALDARYQMTQGEEMMQIKQMHRAQAFDSPKQVRGSTGSQATAYEYDHSIPIELEQRHARVRAHRDEKQAKHLNGAGQ